MPEPIIINTPSTEAGSPASSAPSMTTQATLPGTPASSTSSSSTLMIHLFTGFIDDTPTHPQNHNQHAVPQQNQQQLQQQHSQITSRKLNFD
ncbi:MAG: hypothetical protein WC756_10610 [Taibaiella sp.]